MESWHCFRVRDAAAPIAYLSTSMVIRGALPFVLLVVSAELCPAQVQTPAHGLPVIQKPAGAAVPAVQFVCITRERGPKPQKDWSDMQVTLWDVAVAKPAVRRIVFGRSHWNAAPLFDAPPLSVVLVTALTVTRDACGGDCCSVAPKRNLL